MFGFFKRKKQQDKPGKPEQQENELLTEDEAPAKADDAAAETGAEAEESTARPEAAAPDEAAAVTPPEPSTPQARAPAPDEAPTIEPEPTRETGAAADAPTPATESAEEAPRAALQEKPRQEGRQEKAGWFARIRSGLGKTRANLSDGLAGLFLGKKQIDDELMEDLETQLLMADVGIEATTEIIDRLTERVSRKELKDPEALFRALQDELATMLETVTRPLELPSKGEGPFVILVVGVNGVGKTTTIGKLTQRFLREGRSVMLAAGDTFRAAAVEQLKVWGERNDVPVIAQHTGADSASVIYDAVAAAKARGIDVLIADTAGRLHNKAHLMEELKKVHRVMGKLDATAPHEVMLVLDAGTGQNALSQASTFNEAVPVTGVTLTKLDGTAKGGIIFALAKQLGTPIRFIGVGESLDDLRPFVASEFVDALFDRDADRDAASA
ncbi:signal recognition particle-docking protein FtsY [Halomonas sp. LBP4]|uniref:signal recognition particle-docking protein FtsY n=1 Tax=Halomonas sp. LBP4 TaxID=2044917 RepID=UPI000D764932|nr:signal recognition particle-docking protein FtsY [Halomonas sp. LBP4]PXX98134.1 signal recognition particle-docking protein FtsY [Halomonas sp. LBP4]